MRRCFETKNSYHRRYWSPPGPPSREACSSRAFIHRRHPSCSTTALGLSKKKHLSLASTSFLLRPSTVQSISPPSYPSSVNLALPVMASKMLLRPQPLRCARPFAQASPAASSRSFVSVAARGLRQSPAAKRPLTAQVQRSALRQPFRRQYADNGAPQVTLSPAAAAKPKKRWGFLRTLWRITYISLLGGAGYMAYTIYDLKHPNEQFEPDPSKKTLVVLGALHGHS